MGVADVENRKATQLTRAIVNNAYVQAFDWMPENEHLLVSTVLENRGEAPLKPGTPKGLVLQETAGAKAPYYEYPVEIISRKGDKIITRRESEKEPPNYFINDLKKKKITRVMNFPHPQPEMRAVNKKLIKYKREDGVDLTAVLYPGRL